MSKIIFSSNKKPVVGNMSIFKEITLNYMTLTKIVILKALLDFFRSTASTQYFFSQLCQLLGVKIVNSKLPFTLTHPKASNYVISIQIYYFVTG